jgi:hypothetical protein
MTLEQMKDWNLGAYEAIVLAGDSGMITAAHAYTGIQMIDFGALATRGEIEIARQSLVRVVQGLAYSLVHRQGPRQEDLLEPATRHLLESFRENLRTDDGVRVIVPKKPSDGHNWRVVKVTFRAHNTARVTGDMWHIAPDPLLLVTKSAINWSRRNNQQLIPTGDYEEEEEEEEEDEQAPLLEEAVVKENQGGDPYP